MTVYIEALDDAWFGYLERRCITPVTTRPHGSLGMIKASHVLNFSRVHVGYKAASFAHGRAFSTPQFFSPILAPRTVKRHDARRALSVG